MVPPADRDVVMGPPPVPGATTAKSKDNHDIEEKYKKLKRRFFELEEVSDQLTLFLDQERKSPDDVLTYVRNIRKRALNFNAQENAM